MTCSGRAANGHGRNEWAVGRGLQGLGWGRPGRGCGRGRPLELQSGTPGRSGRRLWQDLDDEGAAVGEGDATAIGERDAASHPLLAIDEGAVRA